MAHQPRFISRLTGLLGVARSDKHGTSLVWTGSWCKYMSFPWHNSLIWLQMAEFSLKVFSPLVKPNGTAARWLCWMIESSALIGGILSIVLLELYVHPETVDRARQLQQLLQVWSALFQGLSVISNRKTPVHWDTNGGRPWMDILVALRNYVERLGVNGPLLCMANMSLFWFCIIQAKLIKLRFFWEYMFWWWWWWWYQVTPPSHAPEHLVFKKS